MIVPQPLTCKGQLIQPILKALNNQGLSTDDDIEQRLLLKCVHALVFNLVTGYATHILKVRCFLHQRV